MIVLSVDYETKSVFFIGIEKGHAVKESSEIPTECVRECIEIVNVQKKEEIVDYNGACLVQCEMTARGEENRANVPLWPSELEEGSRNEGCRASVLLSWFCRSRVR
jgi:hypothetical protein